ncbi:MAG TPA: 16S rRNA (guanine(966)-N(2))-methyltransferase RsmD [Tessaracoccus flavescens]|uniref:16S rRNA (Guanine(966)-N(2))-methyltransferase RsmD n=1 Tax=Tessaracoccus flavescens TaxID=399497 RepID=A0A921EM05_9ACTN|nr:16S rRNA (guanine(966)-N(2))-methyltransferase RsmD [Tessaracoccus flavescens]
MSRIIAGAAKGKRLATPKGAHTRPTTDRTREALFSALVSWLGTADEESDKQLAGVSFLDLYAGSGAVGLEAASRGAGPVLLVELDKPTAKLIQDNARSTGLSATVRAEKAQAVVESPWEQFDIIFMDPPYEIATDEVELLLAGLAGARIAPRGLVVVERSSRDRAPEWPASFTDTWSRKYGETTLYFGSVD